MASTSPTATTMFGSARVLLYDIDPWNKIGFGVPNFGNRVGTQNGIIASLVDEIGKTQLFIMTHIDAQREEPPSPNTVARMGKVINRVQAILVSRSKDYNEMRLEEGQARNDPEPFLIHPVPYFSSAYTRNKWMREYNRLCMIALTNAMRHPDNNMPLTISTQFEKLIWSFFSQIKMLIGVELLQLKAADVSADTFQFSDALIDKYDPMAVVLNMDDMSDPGPIWAQPTQDDLKPFFQGIPANLIIPALKQYPIGPLPNLDGFSGEDVPASASLVGLSATTGPGGTMGSPGGQTSAAQAVIDQINAAVNASSPGPAAAGSSSAAAADAATGPGAIGPRGV